MAGTNRRGGYCGCAASTSFGIAGCDRGRGDGARDLPPTPHFHAGEEKGGLWHLYIGGGRVEASFQVVHRGSSGRYQGVSRLALSLEPIFPQEREVWTWCDRRLAATLGDASQRGEGGGKRNQRATRRG